MEGIGAEQMPWVEPEDDSAFQNAIHNALTKASMPFLIVKRDKNGWDVEQYATLDEAAAHREILLGCHLDEVFLAKRIRTRVMEYDENNKNAGLGGQDLRRVIAQVMSDGGEWHYQEVYRELRERGLSVRGIDPLATLLTQLSRVPGITPVPPNRSGRYRFKNRPE